MTSSITLTASPQDSEERVRVGCWPINASLGMSAAQLGIAHAKGGGGVNRVITKEIAL